jgi:hypothetical protein
MLTDTINQYEISRIMEVDEHAEGPANLWDSLMKLSTLTILDSESFVIPSALMTLSISCLNSGMYSGCAARSNKIWVNA